jgi:DNA topoisomerase-2
LLSSSNYDEKKERTWGGTNGYGSKLTNIFSLYYEVETIDHRAKKKFIQVYLILR